MTAEGQDLFYFQLATEDFGSKKEQFACCIFYNVKLLYYSCVKTKNYSQLPTGRCRGLKLGHKVYFANHLLFIFIYSPSEDSSKQGLTPGIYGTLLILVLSRRVISTLEATQFRMA